MKIVKIIALVAASVGIALSTSCGGSCSSAAAPVPTVEAMK